MLPALELDDVVGPREMDDTATLPLRNQTNECLD